ncbi:bifunctional ornithine acetyltransferase/N-acetylglutamate synthase [Anaerocolumna sp. MB42-C2]|uniref:bifunctional ornithine acetyltransferase/N-acetylglutamate synthase n=1 Tax=Anaerocolumna sp. MB42-C2 TaxID=3070997 RepID=UPI0027E06ABD|nr:bifunctional ornithine acetyltransferase/N-acetylglutamate synthase [Anaerocolumna sp. MB42-C2]WMJ87741.1 bifunctional ornithine acetyltransferase/N-acetylglutamate synthase [Anaerocolumna sp. MB42-C2]
MEIIKGGVTAAKGFKAAGIYAGIKKKRKDMALVYSIIPAKAAGTFTTNVVKAAPVKWDIKVMKENETAQAVVLNSGVANACTGTAGDENNYTMAEAVAKSLGLPVNAVLTASTGVIGKQLPIDVMTEGAKLLADALADTLESGLLAAEAIMTTDTYSKEYAVTFELGDKTVTVGGMSKGSGMIHPNMATMLGVVTTDIAISKALLQEAISADVKESFNMISVDRDTSTNDSLIVLANGLAGNAEITSKNEDYDKFCKALNLVTTELAKQMAADGEGATKLFETVVVGAKNKEDAVILSKSIITSNLVKTAVYGNDANWGRILCAMGYSGVDFDPDQVDLYIESADGKLKLVENGMATDYSEETATKILSAKEVRAIADIKAGAGTATAWGCDLTYDYVKINADYRS